MRGVEFKIERGAVCPTDCADVNRAQDIAAALIDFRAPDGILRVELDGAGGKIMDVQIDGKRIPYRPWEALRSLGHEMGPWTCQGFDPYPDMMVCRRCGEERIEHPEQVEEIEGAAAKDCPSYQPFEVCQRCDQAKVYHPVRLPEGGDAAVEARKLALWRELAKVTAQACVASIQRLHMQEPLDMTEWQKLMELSSKAIARGEELTAELAAMGEDMAIFREPGQ